MCHASAPLLGSLALALLVPGAVAYRAGRRAVRGFRAHEAEIDRRNAELDERNRRGCRRTAGGI